jgi:hypothetical protein
MPGQGDNMPKFKSHEEYDNWRSQQAIKRYSAKELEKLDAERPVYEGAGNRKGIGIWGLVALIMVGAICGLFFTTAGSDFLGSIMDIFSRFMR